MSYALRVFTLLWIIVCGIVIIILVRQWPPIPVPEPPCQACGLAYLVGIASLVIGVGGLIPTFVNRNRQSAPAPR